MRGVKALIAATVLLSAPAHAIFFFMFPIPKGNVNPDTVNATLEQRRHSMCAAYHINVIDPDLSGKKEGTWRGEILKNTAERMTQFADYKKLSGIYIRQWQLQAKTSYQAGMDYSRMLAEACNKIAFPYDKSQYDQWLIIKQHVPNATTLEALQVSAKPINFETWFSGAQLPKGIRLTSLNKTIAGVGVAPNGRVTYCEINQSSGSDSMDAIACDSIKKNGQFSPEIQGFRIVNSDQDIVIDWAPIFSSQRAEPNPTASSAKGQVVDPTFELAVTRCNRMGYAQGSADYKNCVSRQLELLSK